jgi:hypothetical protein
MGCDVRSIGNARNATERAPFLSSLSSFTELRANPKNELVTAERWQAFPCRSLNWDESRYRTRNSQSLNGP